MDNQPKHLGPDNFTATPTDNYFWMAVYNDGSYDVEEYPSNFKDIKFNDLHHFTLWPKEGNGKRIAICVAKRPGYFLIWRKQRHVTTQGVYRGSDYMLGMEPDNGNPICKEIQVGKIDPYDSPTKTSPNGFRIWLTKEGDIRAAGSFKREDRFEDGMHYISCEIV